MSTVRGGLQGTQQMTSGATVYTATAGVQGNYHFLPWNDWDPWIGLGAGRRGIWIDRDVGSTDSRHGIDLARLTAGVDYRLNSQFPFLLMSASASRRFSRRSWSAKAASAA